MLGRVGGPTGIGVNFSFLTAPGQFVFKYAQYEYFCFLCESVNQGVHRVCPYKIIVKRLGKAKKPDTIHTWTARKHK